MASILLYISYVQFGDLGCHKAGNSELTVAVVCDVVEPYHFGDVVVERLDVRIGPQQLQTLAVRLPQELNPGREDGAVTTVLRVLSADSTVDTNKSKRLKHQDF